MTLEIRLLGALEVSRDGIVVGPGPESIKPRRLLALLALQGNQILSKEWLLDRLWDDPPASARNLVEKYVSVWRKALEPGRLETVGRGYRLRIATSELDLAVHQGCLAEGRALAAAGDHAGAATVLRQALGMWRAADVRDALHELLPETEVRALAEVFLHGLEDWADAALRSGDDHDIAAPLRAALEREPYRERLAELLMWACARTDDHDGAAEIYRTTHRRLTRDLGQEPGEGLRRMQDRVLRRDAALRRTVPGQRITNLSPRRQGFTGREAELNDLRALLRPDDAPTGRGVAVFGGVGTGKTALVNEFARRHSDDYDLVWVVNARTRTAVADGLEALAERLNCPLPTERAAGLTRLWDRLSQRPRWLLIFDDAGSAGDLENYWPRATDGTIVVTSLNPDWGRYLSTLELLQLRPGETVELLGARGVHGPGDALHRLAHDLGGLPLACEQAAAYLRQTGMDVAQYLSLFRTHRERLLERGAPDDHDGSIQATWRLARDRLSTSPAALQLACLLAVLAPDDVPLDLLSAHRGALAEPLASAVSDELALEDVIGEVRRYSLLSRAAGQLRMHPLTQGVITAVLQDQEAEDWRSQARRMLVAAAPAPTSTAAYWPIWKALVPHIVVLASSAPPAPGVEPEFQALLHPTADYLMARGSFSDAKALLERALELTETAGPTGRSVAVELEQARIFMELGDVLYRRGHPKDAALAYDRALKTFRRHHPDAHPWVARSVAGLTTALTCHWGISLWRSDELPRVRDQFEQVLSILQSELGPDSPIVAHAVSGLGQVLQDLGDLPGAIACQERALAVLTGVYGPDHPDVGRVHGKLGFALNRQGAVERARRSHEQALRILSDAFGAGDLETGWPLSNLGVLALDAGDPDQAIDLQMQAERIFADLAGDELPASIARWRLGQALVASGQGEAALAYLSRAAAVLVHRLGPGHPDVTSVEADLGQARTMLAPKAT